MPVTLKLYKFCYCLLLSLLACSGASFAQSITGRVIDSASSRPISNASVYLNGSSTGTTTNERGEFTLRAKASNVPLIVSCIGYESVTLNNYSNQSLTIKLAPRALILNEVTINIGGMLHEKMLAMFLKEFIGTPADGCTISNTEDLKLSFSKKTNRLTATADRPLQIVNKRTGYKISYFLKSFAHTDTTFSVMGTYFFTEDTAGLTPAELRKVLKNRETCYFGSKMHFIRALWEDKLEKNKFEMFDNVYYGKKSIPAKAAVMSYQNNKYFNYKDAVYIVYRNSKTSSLRLAPGRTEGIIDSDGYYDPSLYWWGEMAGQRMAQLLPFEYRPSGEEQAAVANEPAAKKPMFDSLLNLYAAKNQSPLLFIHFDKNVYSNNENVWFTGYLLDNIDNSRYKTLSLALVKDDERSILMDERFVIANGFCFGNTNIPDSVRAGSYTFVAYGNRLENNQPDIIFTQQVTIKTANQQTFNASLNPLDTSATAANQKIMLLVNFINEKSPPSSVPVTYYVGDARKPVTTGAVKTAAGQYIFNIPSNLLSAGNNKLNVQVKYKKEVQDLSITLPVPPQPPQLSFYPEGGNLLSGTVNIVGVEAKTAEGAPLSLAADLYEDDQIIAAVNTNGNGMGKFAVIPKPQKKYRVRLNTGNNSKDYNLPDAVNGAGLSVRRALVNDTLVVDVYSDDPLRKLYLVGHNYRQSFFETSIERFPYQRVKILLDGMPRGIMQLTLVDSIGRPYAERMVFAHYVNKDKLEVTTDNNGYGKRDKVKLKIKLTGDATQGAVSVAVIQENRLELKNKQSIENYTYLNSELSDMPVKENYFSRAEQDIRDLEDVLLIRGWSRYKWTDMLRVRAQDTVQKIDQLVYKGKVSRVVGKFKAPVPVITFNPPATYDTDINGNFVLPDSNLITEPDKKIAIMVAKERPSDFALQIINPYDTVNRQLALLIDPVTYQAPAQASTAASQVPLAERAIRLQEVVIKDKKDNTFYGKLSNRGPNACGDDVCQYGILNCRNHHGFPENTQPVKGQTYDSGMGGRITYMGCIEEEKRPNAIKFKGIYAAQEFYPADYSEVNPSQPEYVSTLYWKNQLILKKGEAQEVSFYTSDITGTFKVIVQGITNNDVIFGETSFRVNK